MVPASFGCGVAVLAAMAMLAPSRAARSAMARPMPREAPVMKSVFPASDVSGAIVVGLISLASLLACEESRKRGAGFVRFETFPEMHGFGIDPLGNSVKLSAEQLPR